MRIPADSTKYQQGFEDFFLANHPGVDSREVVVRNLDWYPEGLFPDEVGYWSLVAIPIEDLVYFGTCCDGTQAQSSFVGRPLDIARKSAPYGTVLAVVNNDPRYGTDGISYLHIPGMDGRTFQAFCSAVNNNGGSLRADRGYAESE